MKDVMKMIGDAIYGDPGDHSLDRPQKHDLQGILDQHAGAEPWSQKRINAWQANVFGLHGRDVLASGGTVDKLLDEVKEFKKAVEEYRQDPTLENRRKVNVEAADIYLCLIHICGIEKIELQHEVDAKMNINVRRKWNVNEAGSGQHVG